MPTEQAERTVRQEAAFFEQIGELFVNHADAAPGIDGSGTNVVT
jgi:hypothetical protein